MGRKALYEAVEIWDEAAGRNIYTVRGTIRRGKKTEERILSAAFTERSPAESLARIMQTNNVDICHMEDVAEDMFLL